jgi:hypothetical protein
MHFSLFICYLHNLMPLVGYAKRNKKNEFKESPKHPLFYLSIHYIFFFLVPILGLYSTDAFNWWQLFL